MVRNGYVSLERLPLKIACRSEQPVPTGSWRGRAALGGFGVMAGSVRALALTLAVAATTTQLIDFGVYGQRLKLLDMMTHRSIFGIVSLAVLAAAACACSLLWLLERDGRRRLAPLGAILVFLLALRLAQPPHVLLLALPASAAARALLWTAELPGPARRVLREGCVVLVLAFVVHGIGEKVVADLGYGPDTWAYQVKAVVKHSGELAGWALVAGGLILALLRTRPRAAVTLSGMARAPLPGER
jgi:hypothetical protein